MARECDYTSPWCIKYDTLLRHLKKWPNDALHQDNGSMTFVALHYIICNTFATLCDNCDTWVWHFGNEDFWSATLWQPILVTIFISPFTNHVSHLPWWFPIHRFTRFHILFSSTPPTFPSIPSCLDLFAYIFLLTQFLIQTIQKSF